MRRTLSFQDQFLSHFSQIMATLSASKRPTRANPAAKLHTIVLNKIEQQQSAGFMRVNHSGEICAQALYQGQAFVAKNASLKQQLLESADEERDHLRWCSERLQELQSRASYLVPLWYAGSFGIGMLAGLVSDKMSLSFLAETEYQVTAHLEAHLEQISPLDQRSRAILEQMREDELQHATHAMASGGTSLPAPVKNMMRVCSKIMTTVAYYV